MKAKFKKISPLYLLISAYSEKIERTVLPELQVLEALYLLK